MSEILKHHLAYILLFLFSVVSISTVTLTTVYYNHLSYVKKQMDKNVLEYGEYDLDRLCEISECSYIIYDNKKITNTGKLKSIINKNNISHLTRCFYYLDGEILIKKDDYYFEINYRELLYNYQYIIYFSLVLLLMYIIPLYFIISKEKENSLLALAGNEALLLNKSMIMITENIHHELNTPLDVIDNKIEKIHRTINKYLEYEECNRDIDKKFKNVDKDFRFIKSAYEQIYSVLDRMRGFKNLRYSNGNKSIYDISEESFKMLNMTSTNYQYCVDAELKYVSIGSKKLKNADLLSIFINHIKNSIEANANEICIKLDKIDGDIAHIHIEDNGNGMSKNTQKNIFKPNFSTKSGITVRGNGMYLNKYLIEDTVGGSISVEKSDNTGTVICIQIPVNIKEF